MGCLQERLGQVKALTDVLASADAAVVLGSVDAVYALGALERCSSVAFLPTILPPPHDEKMRRGVEALRPHLALAKALRDVGRHKEGLQAGLELVRDARAVGYKPMLAEALNLVGWSYEEAGDYQASEQNLKQAIWAAEAGRDDEIRAEAAVQLVGVVGYGLSRPEDGEYWAREADAILERLGPGHERVLSWLLTNRGLLKRQSGDFAGSLRFDEQALALKEKALGPNHPDVASSLANIDTTLSELGQYDRALSNNDRALAIDRRAYGDWHPAVARSLSNRGEALNALGRYSEARDAFQGALARWEDAYGPDHLYLAHALTGLGETDLATGRLEPAVASLERALRIREQRELVPYQIAETRFALARALRKMGADRSRAWRLASQARAAYAALPLFAPRLHRVDDWLASHAPISIELQSRGHTTRKVFRPNVTGPSM
jgi:serine/threonine-protein kinase